RREGLSMSEAAARSDWPPATPASEWISGAGPGGVPTGLPAPPRGPRARPQHGVDEHPALGPAEDHQDTEDRDRREDRHQPPHPVGSEEVDVLAQDAGSTGLSSSPSH